MAVFDVGPVLEGVSSLQGKLEDAITKTRLLLEAIEGSQSKHGDLNGDYPILRSLKGRLAASQGLNESLSTELVKFKLELESFVDEIFESHDSVRQIKRNSLQHAKELGLNRDKLLYEKGELAAERRKLELEREELDALRRLARGKVADEGNKMPDQGQKNLNRVERAEKSAGHPEDGAAEENKENGRTKAALIEFCDTGCQTEPEINATVEMEFKKCSDQDFNTVNAESQTEPMRDKMEEQRICKQQDTDDNVDKLFADSDVYHHTVPVKHHCLLSCRPQTTYRTTFAGSRQRVATAPVSRAKALLFARQGQALRIHKALLDQICQMKEEIQLLKLENAASTKRANEANSELFYVKNELTVNIADRDELQKKLHKYKEQIQKLEDTLRKQAYGLVHNKKQQRQLEEELRWSQILTVPLYGPSSRNRSIQQERKSTKGP